MPNPIISPRRLLLLTAPKTATPVLFSDSEIYNIDTPYYCASVPIWRDQILFEPAAVAAWKHEWNAAEAGEVVQAIGAWVICFPKPASQGDLDNIKSVLKAVYDVIKLHADGFAGLAEPVMSAVGMQQSTQPALEMSTEQWDNICWDCGQWEWIDGTIGLPSNERRSPLRNEYQELVGIARLKESLETNDWEGGAEYEGDLQEYVESDRMDKTNGVGRDLDMEAMAVRAGCHGVNGYVRQVEESASYLDESAEAGSEEDIREVERMMTSLQAIRNISNDIPEAERRSLAARAVNSLMKGI